MTVGLFGGAFDPPHNGHVAVVRAAIPRFSLERVVVVTTGTPPHKGLETPAEVRHRLAELAFGEIPGAELSTEEIDRGGVSYTVDTLRRATARHGDVVFLVGADEFADFLSWRDPDGILELARLGVATRPGFARAQLDRVLSHLARPERVELFEIEALPIASSEIRARIARGEAVDELLPAAVAAEIARIGLYRSR